MKIFVDRTVPFVCFYFVFVYCLMFVIPKVNTSCSRPIFRSLEGCSKNTALAGFVFENHNVTFKEKCGRLCTKYTECTSFNVGLVPDAEGKFQCELNSKFYTVECSHLTTRQNFEFYQWVDKVLYPESCEELEASDPSLLSGVYQMKPDGSMALQDVFCQMGYHETCEELKEQHPEAPSGVYRIRPTESVAVFSAYCDMDTAGGGWTLIYSYKFLQLTSGNQARLSVWPDWPFTGETPKSTTAPLSDLEEGALDFDLWNLFGEEFLYTSTVTNWYQCAPSASSGTPGSLTQWRDGDLDCSVVKVEFPELGCDDVVPVEILVTSNQPKLRSNKPVNFPNVVFFEGQNNIYYPTHDPCGRDGNRDLESRSTDPRGAIYVR